MNGKEVAQRLLDAIITLAEKMLVENGEFHPYGGMVQATGDIVDVGAQFDGDEERSSIELIALLKSEFKSIAISGELMACAVVSDVRVRHPAKEEKVDAIRVSLDCADGYSIEVFKPYLIQPTGEVVFFSLFAQKGRQEIFVTVQDRCQEP